MWNILILVVAQPARVSWRKFNWKIIHFSLNRSALSTFPTWVGKNVSSGSFASLVYSSATERWFWYPITGGNNWSACFIQSSGDERVSLYTHLQVTGQSVRLLVLPARMRVNNDSSRSSEFTIECQGVGVLPPLSLSSTVLHLPATPINDQSIAVFYVENRHLDKNHFKHPVPRIGNGTDQSRPRSLEF